MYVFSFKIKYAIILRPTNNPTNAKISLVKLALNFFLN